MQLLFFKKVKNSELIFCAFGNLWWKFNRKIECLTTIWKVIAKKETSGISILYKKFSNFSNHVQIIIAVLCEFALLTLKIICVLIEVSKWTNAEKLFFASYFEKIPLKWRRFVKIWCQAENQGNKWRLQFALTKPIKNKGEFDNPPYPTLKRLWS